MWGKVDTGVSVSGNAGPVGASAPIISKGKLCSKLERDGLVINALRYEWWSGDDETCDWWVDFDFYDGSTREHYYHDQGGLQAKCGTHQHGTRTGGMPILARQGEVCITLFQNRNTQIFRLGTTCENIS